MAFVFKGDESSFTVRASERARGATRDAGSKLVLLVCVAESEAADCAFDGYQNVHSLPDCAPTSHGFRDSWVSSLPS